MDKEIDRIAKGADTDIVIRIDEFNGRKGVTIREYVKTERYTGFTKSGTRIPADKFKLFKQAINSIDEKDLESSEQGLPKTQATLPAEKPEKAGKNEEKTKDKNEDIREEEF